MRLVVVFFVPGAVAARAGVDVGLHLRADALSDRARVHLAR